MSQFLSLSRAARLVGVNRSELQKRVKQGELDTFDGMVTVEHLLDAYPGVQLEDNTEYSRVLFIKEKAFGKRVFERVMPDVETLATRIHELSRELTLSQSQVKRFKNLLDNLYVRLSDVESQRGSVEVRNAMDTLKNWLVNEVKEIKESDLSNPLAVRDNMLRVVAAHVTVLPSGHDFFIDGPDTILEGALRAGVPLNYGCSGGNCGLCKAKVISGQVKKTRFHDYVRTEADKRDDLFLMCSNTAVSDLVIEAAVAGGVQDIPFQQIGATVKVITPLNQEMALLHLQTPRTNRLRFLAGQSVNLILGKSLHAMLAVASCPCDDRNILFHVPRKPGNLFSDYVFNRLKSHEVVEIEGPYGEFILHEKTTRPLYFIAFDTGFSPIKSLIEHAMSLDVAEAIHLYWVGSNDDSIYLPNVGRAWADALDNFYYTQLVAGFDMANLGGKREESIKNILQEILRNQTELKKGDVYLAGCEGAVKIAEQFLLDLGMPKSCVFISA
jgi:CDP-4-dehydro-6-deoxyglucose reductase, E3